MSDTVKHFAECGASIVELTRIQWADTRDFARTIGRPRSENERMVREGHLFASGMCPLCARIHPSGRRIYYSDSPSKHACNAKCMGAVGRICECSCGGKNHGVGFVESLSLFEEVA
jgi:hypothetical protein